MNTVNLSTNNLSEDQLIRAAVLRNIDVALRGFGLDADAELRKLGYEPGFFNHDDDRLRIDELARIIEHCTEITECNYFSLVMAGHQHLDLMGSVGLLMQTAPTLRAALQELSQVLHVHASPVSWEVEEDGRSAIVQFSFQDDIITHGQSRLLSQLSIAQCWRILKDITNSQIYADGIYFRQSDPGDHEVYRDFFNAPVHFTAARDCLVIDKRLLSIVPPFNNSPIHELIKEKIYESAAFRKDTSLMQKIKIIIRSQLGKQACNLTSVSAQFGCDKRTLQRHLRKEDGVNFQFLLDEVRMELAQFYLSETPMPVMQVAFALGYSDSSNFTRAFRKYFSCSPAHWRSQNKFPIANN